MESTLVKFLYSPYWGQSRSYRGTFGPSYDEEAPVRETPFLEITDLLLACGTRTVGTVTFCLSGTGTVKNLIIKVLTDTDDRFLGNNAASINKKGTIFFFKKCFFKSAFMD